MRRIRIACTAVVAAAAIATLGACNNSKSSAAGSDSAGGSSAGSSAGSGGSIADTLSLVGKSTSAYKSVHIKADTSVGSSKTTMTGTLSWNPVAEDITMSSPMMGSSGMHMLVDGSTAYMQVAGKWTKLDLSKLMGGGSGGTQDPASMVQLLTSSGDLKKVGQETVNGVSATHYAGTVDIQKVAQQSGMSQGVKALLSQAAKQGLSTQKVDLWADAQNLPVQVRTSAQSSMGTVDSTIEYSDYSTSPVKAAPPTAG